MLQMKKLFNFNIIFEIMFFYISKYYSYLLKVSWIYQIDIVNKFTVQKLNSVIAEIYSEYLILTGAVSYS